MIIPFLFMPSSVTGDFTGCTTSGVTVDEVGGGCSGNYGRESGASSYASAVNRAFLGRVQVNCSESSAGGTISGTFQDAIDDGRTLKLGIYSDNAGEPDTLLWSSASGVYNAGSETSFELVTDTFSGVTFVSGNYYWFGFVTASADTNYRREVDVGTTRYDGLGSFAFPATWDTGGDAESTVDLVTWIAF